MLLYPNLGEAIQKSTTAELPFYFTLYGNVHDAKATVQLLRNGLAIAETPLQLPASTGSRVQQVGRMPIGALPAGTYELRIRVTAERPGSGALRVLHAAGVRVAYANAAVCRSPTRRAKLGPRRGLVQMGRAGCATRRPAQGAHFSNSTLSTATMPC